MGPLGVPQLPQLPQLPAGLRVVKTFIDIELDESPRRPSRSGSAPPTLRSPGSASGPAAGVTEAEGVEVGAAALATDAALTPSCKRLHDVGHGLAAAAGTDQSALVAAAVGKTPVLEDWWQRVPPPCDSSHQRPGAPRPAALATASLATAPHAPAASPAVSPAASVALGAGAAAGEGSRQARPKAVGGAGGPGRVSEWRVDAKKLNVKGQKLIVSPTLVLHLGAPAHFLFMIHAKKVATCRFGGTFRLAKGRGQMQLKCQGNVKVTFRVTVGTGQAGGPVQELAGGSLTHDFREAIVCNLPDEWDFSNLTEATSQTFTVRLEVTAVH